MKQWLATSVFFLAITFLSGQNYVDEIKKYTTDSKFLPPMLLNISEDPNVPSPMKHFGHIIGAEGKLHRSAEIYGYYKKLEESSQRIKFINMGTSEEGRPFYIAVIAEEATLKRLDHFKNQTAMLADPRKFDPADLEKILNDSKPIYYVSGGMHATEMGAPEMLMEMAYRLVTSGDTEIKKIRENIITIINPVSEPDGWDKQVDWYYRYTKGRKQIDDGFPRSVPYWGKYVFHDNNRDGLQVSQGITKSIYKAFFEYHPTVMLDLHESLPLFYVSTGTGPYNDFVDPITVGEWQIMANYDLTTMASEGMPGAFTWAFYDGWWPGYGIWIANNHNSNGRFYETFGNAGADTYLRDLSNARFANDLVTSKQWYRPSPPTQQVNWSLRNNVNYCQVGALASLMYAANNSDQLMKNFYLKAKNSLTRAKESGPKAYIIPKKQKDPAMVNYMVNQLMDQAIEVHENDTNFVVLTHQPYRDFAVSLLTKQNYPADAKYPPYDGIAWTLQYLNGINVTHKDSLDFDVKSLKPVLSRTSYKGTFVGKGNDYIIKYQAQNTLLGGLYSVAQSDPKIKIFTLTGPLKTQKDSLTKGTILITGVTPQKAESMAREFGIDLTRDDLKKSERDKFKELKLPRIAIYHTWYNTQDEGWARYTFEQRKIPYTSIHKDDLKAGGLRAKFDVILIPRVRGEVKEFVHEIDASFGPMPYTKTDEFPSHGTPSSTTDMTGGPGYKGIAELESFANDGGLIIALDNTSKILADLGFMAGVTSTTPADLFHPGSIVQAKIRNKDHVLMNGYPEYFTIYRSNGPLLQMNKYQRGQIIAQYGTKPLKDEEEYTGMIMGLPDKKVKSVVKQEKDLPYVLSGMVRNSDKIIGHGAVIISQKNNGNIVAFTFDPLHRYLNHSDAPMVWNAILNWDNLRN